MSLLTKLGRRTGQTAIATSRTTHTKASLSSFHRIPAPNKLHRTLRALVRENVEGFYLLAQFRSNPLAVAPAAMLSAAFRPIY